MNWKHLIWITPFLLVTGMLFYALLDNQSNKLFMPIIETCVGYEANMDMAVILLQSHCLRDDLSQRRNLLFCDEFQNQSKILSLYNWSLK